MLEHISQPTNPFVLPPDYTSYELYNPKVLPYRLPDNHDDRDDHHRQGITALDISQSPPSENSEPALSPPTSSSSPPTLSYPQHQYAHRRSESFDSDMYDRPHEGTTPPDNYSHGQGLSNYDFPYKRSAPSDLTHHPISPHSHPAQDTYHVQDERPYSVSPPVSPTHISYAQEQRQGVHHQSQLYAGPSTSYPYPLDRRFSEPAFRPQPSYPTPNSNPLPSISSSTYLPSQASSVYIHRSSSSTEGVDPSSELTYPSMDDDTPHPYSPRPSSNYTYPHRDDPSTFLPSKWEGDYADSEHAASVSPRPSRGSFSGHLPAAGRSADMGPLTTTPIAESSSGQPVTATAAALSAHPNATTTIPGVPVEGSPADSFGLGPGEVGAGVPGGMGSAAGLGGLDRMDRMGKGRNSKTYSFVSLPGNAVKKRPRRRYDEIERLYRCSFPNCTKAYGTLNHLNAHVTMQKHGGKRSPGEFKELRKQWRMAKKEADDAERERERHERALASGGAPLHSLYSTHGQSPHGHLSYGHGHGYPLTQGPLHPHAQSMRDCQAPDNHHSHRELHENHRLNEHHRGLQVQEQQQQYQMAMMRRRGSQPYPSPHALSPSSQYSVYPGGRSSISSVSYQEDEYGLPSPVEDMRFGHQQHQQSQQDYDEDLVYRSQQQGEWHSQSQSDLRQGQVHGDLRHSHGQQMSMSLSTRPIHPYFPPTPNSTNWEPLPGSSHDSISLSTLPGSLSSTTLGGTSLSNTTLGASNLSSLSSTTLGGPVSGTALSITNTIANVNIDDDSLLTQHVSLGHNRLPSDSTLLTPYVPGHSQHQEDGRWDGDV